MLVIVRFHKYIGFRLCVSSVLLQDEEINQQSQLVENLKEQMLNLEEVTQYFLLYLYTSATDDSKQVVAQQEK